MTNFEQKLLEDNLLSDYYLNFSEYLVDDDTIFFTSRFPIDQKKEVVYIDDKFMHAISQIKSEHVEILKSRLVDGQTLQEIADKYKLTRERIRQIEASAIKKIMLLMDRQLVIDIINIIEKQSVLFMDQLSFKDEALKRLFAELLSQSKHKVHFDKELMALVSSNKISFLKINDRIQEVFENIDIPIFSKKYLIEVLQSCFPSIKDSERLFTILIDKQMLKKLDNDQYFFQYLYKYKRPKIEFLFSLYPEGLEVYKQIDYIKDELDRFFPNVFDESDRNRGISTAVMNSDYLYLWAWGKYIHVKYIQPILEDFDFTNILEYLDQHVSDNQIELNLCFDTFNTELVNAGIPDKNALHTCLKLKYPDEYTFQRSPWISKTGSDRTTRGITLKNLLADNRIYTLDELVTLMHSSKLRIQQLIDHSKDIVAVDTFKYKQKQFIDFPEQLIEKLTTYANDKVIELDYFYIDLIINTFSDELRAYEEYDVRTLVLELFKKQSKNKKFNISNTRIVNKNYPITNESLNFHVLTHNFFREKDIISLNEISDFNFKRGLTPNLVMAYFLNSKIKKIARIERETFTSLDRLGLSPPTIENINLLLENTVWNEELLDDIIKTIKLPTISVAWNRYLLTDIMDNYRFLFLPSRENPIYIKRRDMNEE